MVDMPIRVAKTGEKTINSLSLVQANLKIKYKEALHVKLHNSSNKNEHFLMYLAHANHLMQ